MFRVRMGTEVTFGQDQNARCPMGLKLVKSLIYDGKPTLFSDSNHDIFKVRRR